MFPEILRMYVCFSGVFIGGSGPPFNLAYAVERGAFSPSGRNAEAGGVDHACFVPGCASCARNGFERHPRTRCAHRRPSPRLPHGNLRVRFFRQNQHPAGCTSPCYPAGRSLRADRCQRRTRSNLGRIRWNRNGTVALGAMQEDRSQFPVPSSQFIGRT